MVLKSRKAFTIMELLLVISLVAIVAAVAIPTFYTDTGKRADAKAIQSLAYDIEYARSMGLLDLPGFSQVVFTAGSNKYEVATKSFELSEDYIVNSTAVIDFDSNGAKKTPGSRIINVSRKNPVNNFARVTVNSAGQIVWAALP